MDARAQGIAQSLLNQLSQANALAADQAGEIAVLAAQVRELQETVTALQKPAEARVTDAMVTRFLGWKLPDDFAPDCGISFTAPKNTHWPSGTNLLHAQQARAMLEHILSETKE